MCGIVGYVGPEQALPILIEGLRRLEYRGYDSAGVAVLDGGLSVVKRAGKLSELGAALGGAEPVRGRTGLGHARVVTHGSEPDLIVGAKVSSPLIVGLGDGENLLASDIPAVMQRTRSFVPVAEGQVAEVRASSVRITDLAGTEVPLEPIAIEWNLEAAEKGGYEDFFMKEIREQPAAIRDTLRGRIDERNRLALDELRLP